MFFEIGLIFSKKKNPVRTYHNKAKASFESSLFSNSFATRIESWPAYLVLISVEDSWLGASSTFPSLPKSFPVRIWLNRICSGRASTPMPQIVSGFRN